MPDPELLRGPPSDLELDARVERPERADLAVLRALRDSGFAEASRASLKALFREGRARLRNRALGASEILAPGRYAVTLRGFAAPRSAQARPAPPESRLASVIHEDDELLVLDKPSGLPSVPHSAEETATAVSFALERVPGLARVGRGGLEPGLLHRLDTGTSGLLAFAKTAEAYERLRLAWKTGQVRKTYRALVPAPGDPLLPRLPATLSPWLGHDAKSARRMRAFSDPERPGFAIRGRPLATLTRIVRAHPASAPGILDLEIEIETGVMHQIRCTLAWIGHPILGDPIYRGAPSTRLWLHAWKLRIPTADGKTLELKAKRWPPPFGSNSASSSRGDS